MGRDKAGLPAASETQGTRSTFVEHIASNLAPVADEVIVAGGASRVAGKLRVVTDHFKGMGPLAGMHAGLQAASQPHVWVVACDLPDVAPQLGPLMLALAGLCSMVPVPVLRRC